MKAHNLQSDFNSANGSFKPESLERWPVEMSRRLSGLWILKDSKVI